MIQRNGNHKPKSISELKKLWDDADEKERDDLLTDMLTDLYATKLIQNS